MPVLWPGGGGGSGRSADLSFYLNPLPPSGPLRLITAWPSRNIPETVTETPADPFLEAAGRVRTLWDPEPEESPRPPPPPQLPPGGWFDRHFSDSSGS